jgi:hypothetical protein
MERRRPPNEYDRNGGTAEFHDERAIAPGRVNMDRLEAELGRAQSSPTSVDNFTKRAQTSAMSKHSPVQTIADAIKRLVWDDNEKLGQLIAEHYASDSSKGSMAAAVQRAADDLLAAAKDQ